MAEISDDSCARTGATAPAAQPLGQPRLFGALGGRPVGLVLAGAHRW